MTLARRDRKANLVRPALPVLRVTLVRLALRVNQDRLDRQGPRAPMELTVPMVVWVLLAHRVTPGLLVLLALPDRLVKTARMARRALRVSRGSSARL